MQIVLTGTDELQAALRNMSDEVRARVSEAVQDTAEDLEAGIKLKIQQGAKTGRVYKRRSVLHQASAPGEAPANDTGVLMGSIYHEMASQLTATVGARAVYALYLEYGTSNMAPRPFFRPAVEDVRATFNKRLEAAIRRATK